jgi:hypothetical protein
MGTEFLNHMFKSLQTKLGVEHRVTSAYHPRANGKTEKSNGVLLSVIRKLAMEHKEDWPAYIPFATLAYNTKEHTTTGFSPYRLFFGREMNSFKDYRNTDDKVNDEEAIYNRTLEIQKQVTEQEEALRNTAKAKERQMKSQNSSNRTAQKPLQPGSHVYISSVGMHHKLFDKYKGPFIIVRQSKSGNYVVKDALNQELPDSFPRERLKVVTAIEEEKEPQYSFERILDDRINSSGGREYLIQWKSGFEPPTWEPAENIVDPDFINQYHKSKGGTSKPAPKKRGRPAKVKLNFLLSAFIFSIFILRAFSQIRDDFYYCDEVKTITPQTKVFDLWDKCEHTRNDVSIAHKIPYLTATNVSTNNSIYTLIYKLPNQVVGTAMECMKQKVKVSTYVNFFGARSEEIDIETTHLNRAECLDLSEKMSCEGAKMECENTGQRLNCKYDGTPRPEYRWLSTTTSTGFTCTVRSRNILASTSKATIFNDQCKVTDWECKMPNSIIVWRQDIVDECPYRKIKTTDGWSFNQKYLTLYNSRDLMLLKLMKGGLTRAQVICENYDRFKSKNKIQIIQTTAGIYVSGETEAQNLIESPIELDTIHDLILVEEDAKYYAEMTSMNKLEQQICLNRVQFLRELVHRPGIFDYLPTLDNKVSIAYSKNGIIVAPHCVVVDRVTFINNTEFCTEDIPVEFSTEDGKFTGYLQFNKIIKKTTNKRTCGETSYIYFERPEKIFHFDGEKIFSNTSVKDLSIGSVFEADFEMMNFPHAVEIKLAQQHVMDEIYEPMTIKKEFETTFKIENKESMSYVHRGIVEIKNFFWRTKHLILIAMIIIVSIIILIICFKLWKVMKIKTKKTKRNRRPTPSVPPYEDLSRSQQDFLKRHNIL